MSNGIGHRNKNIARLAARISHSSRLLLPFQHLQQWSGLSTNASARQIYSFWFLAFLQTHCVNFGNLLNFPEHNPKPREVKESLSWNLNVV